MVTKIRNESQPARLSSVRLVCGFKSAETNSVLDDLATSRCIPEKNKENTMNANIINRFQFVDIQKPQNTYRPSGFTIFRSFLAFGEREKNQKFRIE